MRIFLVALTQLILFTTLSTASQDQHESGCQKCENIARGASPKYRIALRIPVRNGAVFLRISIPRDQFTRFAMIALACRLKQDFPQDDVVVEVFDDHDSAERYREPFEQEKPQGWKKYERSLRATYVHNVAKHEHWIWWDVNPEKTREEKIDICSPTSN